MRPPTFNPLRSALFALVLLAFGVGFGVVVVQGYVYPRDRAAPDFDQGLSDAERDSKYRELTAESAAANEALLQSFIDSGAAVGSLRHVPINRWVDSSSTTLTSLSTDAGIVVVGRVTAQMLEGDRDASTFGTSVVSQISIGEVLKGDMAVGDKIEVEQHATPMPTADGSFVLAVDPADPAVYLDHDVVLFGSRGINGRLRVVPLSTLTFDDGVVSITDGASGLSLLNGRTADQALSILRACLADDHAAPCG